MTTVEQIVQPDLEAWVWANVRHLPGVTAFTYAVVTPWPPWVVAYSVQVDARATTKQAARDLAEQVRQIITALPDPDAAPRYVARYEIRAHPAPDSPLSQMPRARADRMIGRKHQR